MELTIYCDGACYPINPGGTAAWGIYAVLNGQHDYSAHGVVGSGNEMTNNVAEYVAVIRALHFAELHQNDRITICGDSKLWVNQLSGKWRIKNGRYRSYALQAKKLLKKLRGGNYQIALKWIPREENARADELSKIGDSTAVHPRRTAHAPRKRTRNRASSGIQKSGTVETSVSTKCPQRSQKPKRTTKSNYPSLSVLDAELQCAIENDDYGDLRTEYGS